MIPLSERISLADRKWEEANSNLRAGKQNWQRIAFAAMFVALVAVVGAIYLGQLPKQVLYVIDRTGSTVNYAGPVKPVNMDDHTWDLVKVESLKRFLTDWRTVTTDKTAQELMRHRAYLFIGSGSPAKSVLDQWFFANDPSARVQNNSNIVLIHYRTFDVEGSKTYGLWWQEDTITLDGRLVSSELWRARMVYEIRVPTKDEARQENSLGVLITELSFEKVQ